MSDNITKRVGLGTAYGFAKAGGYEGTVAEFTELLGNIAIDLARIENLSVTVTTLPAGSQATASLNGSVLSLGIPKGDKGDKGNTGETGAPAGFGTVSATVDSSVGTPSVEVTASGADTAKNFAFAFHNLKGQKGDKGDTGDVTLSQLEDFTVVQTDENVEPYNFRATPKCGHIERLGKVVGVSVAFNQLVQTSGTKTDKGVTATFNSNTNKFELSGTSDGGYASIFSSLPAKNGHVYVEYLSDVTNPNSVTFDAETFNVTGQSYKFRGNGFTSLVIKATNTVNSNVGIQGFSAGTSMAGISLRFAITDLTLALGSTIADYVYSLEQATAGAGVTWLKQHFPKMFGQYNAYDAGSIRSVEGVSEHKVVGFNQWDEEWENGTIDNSTGLPVSGSTTIRSKNYIPAIGGQSYYCKCANTWAQLFSYDANHNLLEAWGSDGENPKVLPNNACYIKFRASTAYGTTYKNDICINISDTSKNGTYEPYTVNSYPLDSDLTLRGMLKIQNGNLYAGGDEYGADGSVSRKWTEVDLGSLTWSLRGTGSTQKVWSATLPYDYYGYNVGALVEWIGVPALVEASNAVSLIGVVDTTPQGVYSYINAGVTTNVIYAVTSASATKPTGTLIYKLATPTTETADPFTENQICESGGTEEFVSTSIVPIGHETEYPLTLSDIRPTANGNYVLKCTVSNGKASYEWVSA